MNEIRQALATGQEVITHTDRISVPGFTGEGYILFDPVSGHAAYKITGGANGGSGSFLDFVQAKITHLVATHGNAIVAAIIAISAALVIYALALIGAGLVATVFAALIALLTVGATIALDADALGVSLARLTVVMVLLFLGPFELVVIPLLIALLAVAFALIMLLSTQSTASGSNQRSERQRVLLA